MRWLPLLLTLAACDHLLAPPPFAVSFTPPAEWADWYADVARCAGLSGRYADLDWYYVPLEHGFAFTWGGALLDGLWQPTTPRPSIYLFETAVHEPEAAASDSAMHAHWLGWREALVRHEMLHDLRGKGGHPQPPFGMCASMMGAT